MYTEDTHFKPIVWFLLFLIAISVLFHHEKYDY